MERRDWMSEQGYESGLAAERRLRDSLAGGMGGTAMSKKMVAAMLGIGCSTVFATGYMLWPYLLRFLTLSDKGSGSINGADNVDWEAAWALVLAVGLVAMIVFAYTKAISLKSIGSYFSEIASFVSMGGDRATAILEVRESRHGSAADTPGTSAGTGKLPGSQKTLPSAS